MKQFFGKWKSYFKRLLTKVTRPSNHVVYEITCHQRTIISPLLQCLSSQNLERWWLTLWGSYSWSHIFLESHGLVRSRGSLKNISTLPQQLWPTNLTGWWHTMRSSPSYGHKIFQLPCLARSHNNKLNFIISTCTTPMDIKHCKVVTCHEGLPPINPNSPFNTLSRDVMRQIKNISPLQKCYETWQDGDLAHMNFQLHGLGRSCDTLKIFYSTTIPTQWQTWHGGGIQWGFSTLKVTWSFNHVDHVTNQIRYICTCRRPMGTKLNEVGFSVTGNHPWSHFNHL